MENSIKSTFEKAIEYFLEEGKKIDGIYDLLVRGGNARNDHLFIENWSDLDLSVIIEKLNLKSLQQTKTLYQSIKIFFPYKLSITLVSKKDFFSPCHHHGIKPIYYQEILRSSISLLQKSIHTQNHLSSRDLQLDCFNNISYLIHDLRGKYLLLNNQDPWSVIEFFCHLIKRTKHLIRNTIFIITGHIDERINPELFQKHFPQIDKNFPDYLNLLKENFNAYLKSPEKTYDPVEAIMNTAEIIYEEAVAYMSDKYSHLPK